MTILATDIVGLGYHGGLAREIARAVNDGMAFATNFLGLGMPPNLATELARQINDVDYNSDFLIGLKMPPELAELIVASAVNPIPPLSEVVHNLTNSNMAIYRFAMQQVRAGTGRCKVICVGDSTFASGSSNPSRLNSSPMQTAEKLSLQNFPTSYFNFFGWTAYTLVPDYESYNSAVDMTGTWAASGSDSVGGRSFAENGVVPTLKYTAEGSVDTFEIYYLRNAALGAFTWSIDGGAQSAPVSQAGANAYLKLTITSAEDAALATPGAHYITIHGSTGSVVINGIAGYNSQQPALDMYNFGYRGSTTGNWNVTTNPWSPLNAIQAHAPDLTLINLGINNWRNDTPATPQFSTDLQAIIDAAKLSGDVAIQVPFPSATSGVAGNFCSAVNQQTYVDAIYALSSSNDIPLVDITELFGSWNAASAAGYTLDTLHPSTSGYSLIADQYVSLLQHAEVGDSSPSLLYGGTAPEPLSAA